MSKRERERAYCAVEVVVSLDYYVIRHCVWVMFDGGLYSVLINISIFFYSGQSGSLNYVEQ